jgi:ribonucleoside-diphosphate reductase alpha chain
MLELVSSGAVAPLVFLAQKQDKSRFRWLDVLPQVELPRIQVQKSSDQFEPFSIEKLANSVGAAFLDARVAATFGNAVTRMDGELNDRLEQLFQGPERNYVERAVLEALSDVRDRSAAGTITTQGIRETVVSALNRIDRAATEAYTTSRAVKVRVRHDDGELKVVRRNNQITPFNVSKIQAAIAKAFLASGEDPAPALILAQQIVERLRQERPMYIHIEVIQDYVQSALMRAGYFRVAERYIAYRARRALLRDIGRESEKEQPSDSRQAELFSRGAGLELFDRAGRSVLWDPRELESRMDFVMTGLELPFSREQLREELMRSVRSGLSRDDFDRTILLNAKALLEKDPEFALVAGRILLTYIYEEVLGWNILLDGIGGLKAKHERYFVDYYVKRGIELERLNPELANFDLKRLAEALDPSSDLNFDLLSIQSLYDRYLIIDRARSPQVRLEVPQIMWMRVAMGLSLKEKNREETAIELYNLYRRKLFCSSTPTLFNSGSPRSQLSSCYLYWVDDTIESIMNRGIAENAFLCKWAGGLGGSWTAVRGTGALIKGTNGLSSGVIPFLKMHNDQLVAVNQGGKRKGAGCAYLEVWHTDIFDFLELRKNTGDERRRAHDMNTACWIPDLFMQRVNERGQWTLFHSSDVPDLHEIYGAKFKQRYEHYEQLLEEGKIPGRKIPALDLWKRMLMAIFETGHPWFTFKDPCNVRSPQDHVGVVHSSNLCTEITLNTGPDETAVCNLGSLVLPTFFKSGELDKDLLRSTVRLAVRMLDNVIDINYYPTEAAQRSNLRHRPIGLG